MSFRRVGDGTTRIQLLAPLTQLGLAPLWLRLPSTLLAIATWFVLSRGLLGAALPSISGTVRVRAVAALFFELTQLPLQFLHFRAVFAADLRDAAVIRL